MGTDGRGGKGLFTFSFFWVDRAPASRRKCIPAMTSSSGTCCLRPDAFGRGTPLELDGRNTTEPHLSNNSRTLSLRSRSASGEPLTVIRDDWDNAKIAVVICDMWDTTQCVSAARRVVEMAPRVNEVAARLRQDGALIVHAPAGCMEYYAGTAGPRARAAGAPRPVARAGRLARLGCIPEVTSSSRAGRRHSVLLRARRAVHEGGPPYPWTHQIESIEISSTDAVTDDGEELLALLEEREIEDVVVMGVHLNRCVLGRPYGIRQLVYWGKRPVLCRDLTDSYHRDPRGHLWGNEQMIAHVERYWCPTVTSDQLVGGAPFQFRNDQIAWPAFSTGLGAARYRLGARSPAVSSEESQADAMQYAESVIPFSPLPILPDVPGGVAARGRYSTTESSACPVRRAAGFIRRATCSESSLWYITATASSPSNLRARKAWPFRQVP